MPNNRKKRSTIPVMLIGLLPALVCVALLGMLRAQSGDTVNYLNMHLSKYRLGWNPNETQLTPANIRNGGLMEKWRNLTIEGQVYATPLYYTTPGGTNLLVIVTQTNRLYLLNADTGAVQHQQYLLNERGQTERALNQWEFDFKSRGGCGDISDKHGVTGTPVIDGDTGVMYVVNLTMERNEQVYKLHALDLTSNPSPVVQEVTGYPRIIRGSYEGEGFQALMQTQRGALNLHDGRVWITFSSRCDAYFWHGWVFGYDTSDPTADPYVFNTSPDWDGAGIWGPGAISFAEEPDGWAGYIVTGNAWAQSLPVLPGQMGHSFPQAILRLNPSNMGQPFSYTPRDFFQIPDYIQTTIDDTDLGGSSGLPIPDQTGTKTPRLLVTAGKEGRVFLINRDNLGGYRGQMQYLNIGRGSRVAPTYFADQATGKNLFYITPTGSEGPGNNYMDWRDDPLHVAANGDEHVSLSSGPAMAEFQDQLFIAWVNYDTSNPTNRSVLVKASPDGKNWSADPIPVGGQALVRTSPNLAVFNGSLYITWIDAATKRIMVKSSADGVNWSGDAQMLNPVAAAIDDREPVYNTWATLAVFNNKLYLSYISATAPYNIMLKSSADGSNWSSNDTVIHPFTQARVGQGAPFIIAFNGRLYAFWIRSTGNPPDEDRSIDYKWSTDGSAWPANPTPFNESVYRNSGFGGFVLNTVLTGPNPGPPRLHLAFISNDLGRTVLTKSLGTHPVTNPDATGNQNAFTRPHYFGDLWGANGGQPGCTVFRGVAYHGFGSRQPNRELLIKPGTAVYRDNKGLTAFRLVTDAQTGESRFYPEWTSLASTSYNNYLPGSPFVTSNGGNNGIVWVAEGWRGENNPGILHAHNAVTGEELFPLLPPSELPIGGRKFQNVVVVNGRVYLASNGVVCYGLR